MLLSCLSNSLDIRTLDIFFSNDPRVSRLEIIIVLGQSNLNRLWLFKGMMSIYLRYSSTMHSPVSSFAMMPFLLTSCSGALRSYRDFKRSHTISSTRMKCAPSLRSGLSTAFCHLVALATSNRYCAFGSYIRMSSFVIGPGACLVDNSDSLMSVVEVCPVSTSSNTYLLHASNHEFPIMNQVDPSLTSLCIDAIISLISTASFTRSLGTHSGIDSTSILLLLVYIGI